MKLVHISDLHLGYRAYSRTNNLGINAREADVFAAFRRCIKKIIEISPDIVIISGDIFHVVRPSNLMIEHTFQELLTLRSAISAPVVMIGGNHETPRSLDTGCILDLFRNIPGFHVVHSKEENLRFPELDLSVLCLCHRAIEHFDSVAIQPDPESSRNILAVHGTVEGVMKQSYDSLELTRDRVLGDQWDYIAFGHYHCYTQLAPNAFYSGSVEYTSTNIWSEINTPKGFIEYDIDNRICNFHAIQTRDVLDLHTIDASSMTAEQVTTAIQNILEAVPEGYSNKIIRLIVENVPRSVQKDIDFAFIRAVRSEALHFDLQLRQPGAERRTSGSSQQGHTRSLEDEWKEFAQSRDLPAGVDKQELVDLGVSYLVGEVPAEAL